MKLAARIAASVLGREGVLGDGPSGDGNRRRRTRRQLKAGGEVAEPTPGHPLPLIVAAWSGIRPVWDTRPASLRSSRSPRAMMLRVGILLRTVDRGSDTQAGRPAFRSPPTSAARRPQTSGRTSGEAARCRRQPASQHGAGTRPVRRMQHGGWTGRPSLEPPARLREEAQERNLYSAP